MPGTIEFSESFETGPLAALISTSNTGFTPVNNPLSVFDNTNGSADGSLCTKVSVSSIGAKTLSMTHSFSGSQSNVYMRWALFAPLPGLGASFKLGQANGTTPASVTALHTGLFQLTDNVTGGTSTMNTQPAGWFIVEWNINSTTSTQTFRLYSGLTGAPLETITNPYTGGVMTSVAIGCLNAVNGTFWLDAYADAFDDWVGPLTPNNVLAWVS